jgi:hypothetical protein
MVDCKNMLIQAVIERIMKVLGSAIRAFLLSSFETCAKGLAIEDLGFVRLGM